MSADSDISTLLSHATSAASSLANRSSNLVSQATTALVEEVEFSEGSRVTNRGKEFFDDKYVDQYITDAPPPHPAFPVLPEV